MLPPRLRTERLLLREFRPEDVAPHVASARDPEVQRFLGGVRRPYDAFTGLAAHAGHWALRGYGGWVVERRADGEQVGRVGLWHPEEWPGLEVGWRLLRAAWGHGYATEAARAAIGYAWTVVDAPELISLIASGNDASERVAQRLGHVNAGHVELPMGTANRWVLTRPAGDAPWALRAATPGDAQALSDFVEEAFERYRDISPPGWTPPPPDLGKERDTLAADDAFCTVAEPGGVLAGVVSWRAAATSRLVSDDAGLVHFGRLFVHPGWWGSGLAGRLHDVAVAAARTHGFRAMVLFTPLAQGRARRFYERRGWRLVAEHHHDELFGMGTVEYALDL